MTHDGSITYSEIKAFMDKKESTVTLYKSIETAENKTINLSGKHFIYVKRSWTEKFKAMYVFFSSQNF